MHRARSDGRAAHLRLLLLGCLIGCQGLVVPVEGDPSADPSGAPSPHDPTADPTGRTNAEFLISPFSSRTSGIPRKLTTKELANTFSAIFGFVPPALDTLPADSRLVESQSVTTIHEEAYVTAANEVFAALMGGRLPTLIPTCAPAPSENTDSAIELSTRRPCALGFVEAVVPAAWRRPITAEHRSRLLGLYDQSERYIEGMRLLVHAIFRSPNFLYLVELGQGATTGGPRRLTDHELAARLSYAVCQMPPDPQLRLAADRGTLSDPEAFRAQIHRLLDQSCARETIRMLWDEWLGLDRMASMTHDPDVFPEYTPAMGSAMAEETYTFLDHLLFEANASLKEVFSADYSFLNPQVAPLYGLGDARGRTTLPPERRGLLTQPSLLSLWSLPDQTSPIKRGARLVIYVLCGRLPPQPDGLVVVPPSLDPGLTTRERYEQHRANPTCAACHDSIDPPGFALENFDALGRHRSTENGRPIDARGGIPILGVDDLTITGGAALAEIVASAPELGYCFTRRALRFVLGRGETAEDLLAAKPVLDLIDEDAGLKDILVATMMTETFQRRPLLPRP